ncbi:hypothetical protein BKA64DRAFT_587455 [Cadophora sp. MPI-SDFR-AT-0126]|nr:hypothetical protein BKA64DRAFT_587455 [Leotiomycetes sp. MPI-SDFR-AT-0126]
MTVPDKVSLSLHDDDDHHITPPGSFIASPPTPPPSEDRNCSNSSPAVLRVLKDIRWIKKQGGTRVPIPWAAYKLDAEEYSCFEQQLQRDEELAGFAGDKLRFDYFPSSNRLILRMPGDIHERFIARIVEEIQDQLKAIRGPSASFARQITTGASSRIKFPDKEYGSHDPDAQFDHSDAQYPGVVIEVSHTQKRRDLPHLADDYILGSDANIKVVVGLDIEYRADKAGTATISVWRPAIEVDEGVDCLVARQTVDSQMFRDRNGNAISSPESDLRISLQDFAPETLFEKEHIPEEEIVISASKMCEFLEAVEIQSAVKKSKMGAVNTDITKTWKKKRRRELTPAEELLERDEKRFKAEEDEISRIDTLADPDFTPSDNCI